MLRLNLFVYPRYHHYYFGDYYDDAYARVGILPWFKSQTVHTWYDPLFVYDRWHFQRTDPHWAENQARGFEDRRSNRDLRPARTYVGLQAQMARLPANRRPERPLVESVKTYATSQHTPMKFERITTVERQQIAVKAADVRSLRDQRGQWEAQPVAHRAANVPTPRAGTTTKTESARTEARPVTKPEPPTKSGAPPNAAQVAKTTREARPPAVVPARQVRVTQPERETVTSPPRTPQPAQERFIPKQPPSRPVQEQSHLTPQTRPTPTASPNKDQKR
jgi:hypothetical protein